jgi:hypothetical protein
VTSLFRFGGGGDNWRWQSVIFLKTVRQRNTIGVAVTLGIEIPERGLGDAGDEAADDDLDRQRVGFVGQGDVGVGDADDVVADDVGRFLKPPGA